MELCYVCRCMYVCMYIYTHTCVHIYVIARSIFLGIHDYFKENELSESWFNSNSKFVLYEIQRGDVLSEIAVRFGVSVDAIQEENSLKNSPIYPGQIIKIKI